MLVCLLTRSVEKFDHFFLKFVPIQSKFLSNNTWPFTSSALKLSDVGGASMIGVSKKSNESLVKKGITHRLIDGQYVA